MEKERNLNREREWRKSSFSISLGVGSAALVLIDSRLFSGKAGAEDAIMDPYPIFAQKSKTGKFNLFQNGAPSQIRILWLQATT